ncbi:patatin-like phospholipase family protein [Rhodospirillaceae bacterium SYSU D60014]|uniref:patatin-like phospholipase family protein n=1 Tax=Virgifigura deserti TaxID=2268457 RepID=UPI000E66AD42
MTERITLVLSGGNALGTYQAGAYEALHQRGLQPDRIVAASIGAVNAAIVAGNPPERRVESLRQFWDGAAQDGAAWALSPAFWGDDRARVLQSQVLGSPGVFRPRFPGGLSLLPGMPADTSLYDLAPLRTSLERVTSLERLNSGAMRLTVVAVDLITGEEVRFDTQDAPIGLNHLLASSGFPPFFPPVEIDGRLLCDGGMVTNLPLEAALAEPSAEDHLCIAIDLFRRQGAPPKTVGQAVDRQLDLLLTSQTWKAIEKLRRVHDLRRHLRVLGQRLPAELRTDADVVSALAEGAKSADSSTTLLLLIHAPVPHDVEMRAFDFSRPVLTERWEAGRAEMEQALREFDRRQASPGEFVVHTVNGDGGVQSAR